MITTGVTGGRWRASVTPYGAVIPLDSDVPTLDWHIAADDRWHSPADEATVRQRRLDGTAVVETRVRIPGGDAVQRVYSVADHDGLTVVEIENESSLPIAIAFTCGNLLSRRPPTAPIEGIALPRDSVAFPIGHHATLTVAIPHTADRHAGELPAGLPTAAAVTRGWLTTIERAGQLALPDVELNERVVATRCELALGWPAIANDNVANDTVVNDNVVNDNAAGFVVAVDQLVRMGDDAEPWVPHVANALEVAARTASSAAVADWFVAAALGAAARVFAAAGDHRALRDLTALCQRLRLQLERQDQLPAQEPTDPVRALAWTERRLVAPSDGRAALLSAGLLASWLGHNFEVFNLPTGATGTVSFALRWHGERPAVLWEQAPGASGPVMLMSPTLAPQWSSAELVGEALWNNYHR